MFDKVDIRVDSKALAELAKSSEARDALQSLGDEVAGEAARNAPRRTGAGADSIHAETVKGEDGTWEARVSWDRKHFYLYFVEVGTRTRAPRPFLRPAFRRRYGT